jgi:hypothetical protein
MKNEISVEQRMTEAQKLIDKVKVLSYDFFGLDMPVDIDTEKIVALSEAMLNEGKSVFPSNIERDLNNAQSVLVELFASSINYCFWYGKYDFKMGGSVDMYDIIIEAVKNKFDGVVGPELVNAILDRLIFDRYPLIEDRTRHLLETSLGTQEFIMFVLMNRENDARIVLHELVRRYPGFASDMFLKRAFLFIMQLNRKLNFFSGSLERIPVPADYQVPKMLEHFGCLKYKPALKEKIESHSIITRYSIEEISIRSATIVACDMLAQMTGWKASEIDSWLWLRRKECNTPFHLTITTDY